MAFEVLELWSDAIFSQCSGDLANAQLLVSNEAARLTGLVEILLIRKAKVQIILPNPVLCVKRASENYT